MTNTEETTKVAELMRDIKIAMLTTLDEQGNFVSRPMAQQEVEFDGDLWFFAERDSRMVRHLAANPHVAVTLGSAPTRPRRASCGIPWWRPGCRRDRRTRAPC